MRGAVCRARAQGAQARRVMTEESFTAAAGGSLLFLHSQALSRFLPPSHDSIVCLARVDEPLIIILQLDHSPHASE